MKDAVVYYGDSTQINVIDHKNYAEFLKHIEKKQELPGFDEEYLDIVDYILKITHRIWEEKGIGVIYDTYANNCLVHSSDSTSTDGRGCHVVRGQPRRVPVFSSYSVHRYQPRRQQFRPGNR